MFSSSSAGPTSSPTYASGAGSNALDTAPPMPPRQRRAPSVLFTPPKEDNDGLNDVGGDPMVQDMASTKAIDMALQRLAINHPEAVDMLAQFQSQFRQLMAGIMTSQMAAGGGMDAGMGAVGAPNVVPPLPMQSGPTTGQQQGPGI